MAGRTTKINDLAQNLPDMSEVMLGWEVDMIANYVTQSEVNGEIIDTAVRKPIKGIKQPLKAEEIMLKDVGQRSWSWQLIQVQEALYGELFTSQILTIKGINYKIKAKKDWADDGYREYHAILDFEDSGA